jgi:hypothetical protein
MIDCVAMPPMAHMAKRPFKSSESTFLAKAASSLGAKAVQAKSGGNEDKSEFKNRVSQPNKHK